MVVPTISEIRNSRKVFLSVEEIADCLTDFQVFDVRYNLLKKEYGRGEYEKAHIPHATFVDVDNELSGTITPESGRHPLPDAAAFIEWCKAKSIGSGKPVLCYDDECGSMGGCRMWWMLHSLGVEAYVLNGGFQAYRASGLPVETGPQKEKPLSAISWPYATAFQRVYTISEIPVNAVLVDARQAIRFSSTVRPYGMDVIPGHIENAVSLPWSTNVICSGPMKFLKSEDECRSNVLKALSGAWGAGEPDVSNCVFYCGSGVSATFNIALVCHLGLGEPHLYCGSWSQYQTIFAFSLSRHILQEHSMTFKMLSPLLGENQKVTVNNAILTVDGEVSDAPDAEVQEAIKHMHIGEKAQVYFKSGRRATIEATPCC